MSCRNHLPIVRRSQECGRMLHNNSLDPIAKGYSISITWGKYTKANSLHLMFFSVLIYCINLISHSNGGQVTFARFFSYFFRHTKRFFSISISELQKLRVSIKYLIHKNILVVLSHVGKIFPFQPAVLNLETFTVAV